MQQEPNPSGLCMCGCGQKTSLAKRTWAPLRMVKGKPVRFVAGHQSLHVGPLYRIDPESGCWEWLLARDPRGYGRIRRADVATTLAHRWLYEKLVGSIPSGLSLDHLCRNPSCVKPAHLEPVTQAVNMARSAPAQKTECVNGHLYDESNTYIRPNGQRDCRACIRDRVCRYKRKVAV